MSPQHPSPLEQPAVIAIVGTDPGAPGGISRVIQLTLNGPLALSWPLVMVPTWIPGSNTDRAVAFLRALIRVWGLAAAHRLQAVHLHMAARGSFWRKWLIGTPLGWLGVRVIVHIHDGTLPAWWAARRSWTQSRFRRFLEKADTVIALSPNWMRTLKPLAPNASWTVIRNPVAMPPWGPSSPPAYRREDTDGTRPHTAGKTILFLGRLWLEKGLNELLSAACEIHRTRPADTWVLGGDGDVATVNRRVAELGLQDAVHLPGWLNEAQKSRMLSAADLLVLPSHAEGQPLAVLEAMAWGIPIVATEVGDVPDLLACGAGIAVPRGDPQALASAMLCVLQDTDLARRMGEHGRRHVLDHHSVDRVAADLDALYRRLGLLPTDRSRSVHPTTEV